MEKKRLIEILKEIKSDDLLGHGICTIVHLLFTQEIITNEEYQEMKLFLVENLPKPGYYHLVSGSSTSSYSFPYGKIEPRVEWLDKQINKLKDNNNRV